MIVYKSNSDSILISFIDDNEYDMSIPVNENYNPTFDDEDDGEKEDSEDTFIVDVVFLILIFCILLLVLFLR